MNNIILYTDRLKNANGDSSRGFVIFQFGRKIYTDAFSLGENQEPYDAEAHAVLRGIRTAINLPTTRFAQDLWVFIDNIQVSRRVLTKPSVKSSQSTFLETVELIQQWKSHTRLPHIQEGEIKIRWVPGHSGIEGNEIVDQEAKKGA